MWVQRAWAFVASTGPCLHRHLGPFRSRSASRRSISKPRAERRALRSNVANLLAGESAGSAPGGSETPNRACRRSASMASRAFVPFASAQRDSRSPSGRAVCSCGAVTLPTSQTARPRPAGFGASPSTDSGSIEMAWRGSTLQAARDRWAVVAPPLCSRCQDASRCEPKSRQRWIRWAPAITPSSKSRRISEPRACFSEAALRESASFDVVKTQAPSSRCRPREVRPMPASPRPRRPALAAPVVSSVPSLDSGRLAPSFRADD